VSLHIDPNYPVGPKRDDIVAPSPVSAATTCSPLTPFISHAASSGSENGGDEDKDSTSSAPRRKSAAEVIEKRKRSRVTPEQLLHLERFFASDRSPPATRRKEISEMLGMHERQTQIWFQNR
jgi:hypothetical protein